MTKKPNTLPKDKLLSRLSLFMFDHVRIAAILWIFVTVFGVLSYTTFMKREGFPAIKIPYSVISGGYLVNNAQKVDADIAKPVSDIVLDDSRVTGVQAQSQANFYSVVAQYKEGTNAQQAGDDIKKRISEAHILPAGNDASVETPKFGFTTRGDDAVISLYARESGQSVDQMSAEAEKLVAYVKAKNIPDLENISLINPTVTGTNPLTGEARRSQVLFDRYGVRTENKNTLYESVAVGVGQKSGSDVIKLDKKLREVVAAYNLENTKSPFTATVSASYAPDITSQIGELQRALLEGLLAILVIGSIMIAVRASFITIAAMITVLAVAVGVLFLIGYTLNTITLFALILCLGLVVDDTIIMVEAIDAERRKRKDGRTTVAVATRKVSRAMVAATLTAALSFAPLLFVGGVLGGFIRAIPVTVISALLVSLVVALVFIPLFARYLLLGKKQMGKDSIAEPAAQIEAKIARFITRPMLWARYSKRKLFAVGTMAIIVGALFIGAGGFLFQKVDFNIFPPSKDTNGLTLTIDFAPGTTIAQAEAVADKADTIMVDSLGNTFASASYFAHANAQTAMMRINITPYNKRDITSPELQKQLQNKFTAFEGARVKVGQLDVGPPPSAFTVRIETDNREAAASLSKDLNTFLAGKELTRISGEKAHITETNIANSDSYTRSEGKLYTQVTANFDATDTTTLVGLAKTAVEKEFTPERLKAYGLDKAALQFDFGQEDENQESFKALALAFPILLAVIYVLLAIQFRSLLQPLLIFMALPFSLFGITLGLYLTDNSFSFFAMLGFFALIGLSIKNSILLTDYANQLRKSGLPVVDAAVGALSERFRPLVATSLTAVVSLIPLALASPFWEGLAVVLIFGLLSSTFLVVTVFPYYYLGAEFLRSRSGRLCRKIFKRSKK